MAFVVPRIVFQSLHPEVLTSCFAFHTAQSYDLDWSSTVRTTKHKVVIVDGVEVNAFLGEMDYYWQPMILSSRRRCCFSSALTRPSCRAAVRKKMWFLAIRSSEIKVKVMLDVVCIYVLVGKGGGKD